MNTSTHCHNLVEPLPTNATILQALFLTVSVLGGFVLVKSAYESKRRKASRVYVVVVGAGPIGLTSALIALRTGRASKIVVYDEKSRLDLTARTYQLSFDVASIKFLCSIGVEFDSIEGVWSKGKFSTRAGLYLEHVHSLLAVHDDVNVWLRCKFTRDVMKSFKDILGRVLVIVCDGANGNTSRVLGLNDDAIQHSCQAYGAMASLVRIQQRAIPKAEKVVSGLNFDITAYGTDTSACDGSPGFCFKLLGSPRYRCMSLVVKKSNSKLVKALRIILDKSMMRSIFVKCYNTYKLEDEPILNESEALNMLSFSPRVFEVKLFQRIETVSYFDDLDMFLVTEGDAARSINFNAAMGVNVSIRGVESLGEFIEKAACVETEHSIMKALIDKAKHSEKVCRDYLRDGLKRVLFS